MAKSAKPAKKTIQRQPVRSEPKRRDEQIRERAYEIFLARGGAPGHEIDDWLQAEKELSKN
jgi:hypothetical protein